ncbi:MAG: leucine-rich repeat domain-containing protein [Chryseolinea sp.]
MKVVRSLIPTILICLASVMTYAQQVKNEVKQHEQQVRDMVKFLEYILNTLGSRTTSAQDKDIMVTESFTKIFRDSKVQVEDDLVEKRNVITNKDVQAYLKDVDFFFDDVKFEFNIKDIKGSTNASGKLYYKVSIVRNMHGTTLENKVVNNSSPRYIEINYDPKDQDLKIVSIYTKEFDQRAASLTWWKGLSYEWQGFFKKKLNLTTDSIRLEDIQNITSINAVDLSQNKLLQDLEPLTQLTDLQALNLSNTSFIDLTPLRNLTGLTELNISNTKVDDITPLRYSDNLIKFNLSNTSVIEISVLERMTKLENLEMQNTAVTDFSPISFATSLKYLDVRKTKIVSLAPVNKLTMLTELNASSTIIDDLSPLSGLKTLTTLTLDSTNIINISAISSLENLVSLAINYTAIGDLTSLAANKKLERIYCDHTGVKRPVADAFMSANPKVLVISDSEDLRGWWDTLSESWKTVFSKAASIGMSPTNEELAKIPNIDSLNLSGNKLIKDLEPLKRVQKLKALVVKGSGVADLTPLRDHRALRTLDISETAISSIDVAHNFSKMTTLRADATGLNNIDALQNISGIKKLYLDKTAISDSIVADFLHKQPQCLVVYKTDTLQAWWTDLPGSWREVLEKLVPISDASKKEDLHRLVELETIHFRDASISNLSILSVFVRLRELDFSGTMINDVSPLIEIKSLRILRATNSPIRNLEALRSMNMLIDLDVSNTPVEELRPMRGMLALKNFNCSGTQVSSLSALEDITSLESLDCSNTGVKRIDALHELPLKTFKCYNTGISGKTINKFRETHPSCNVVHY